MIPIRVGGVHVCVKIYSVVFNMRIISTSLTLAFLTLTLIAPSLPPGQERLPSQVPVISAAADSYRHKMRQQQLQWTPAGVVAMTASMCAGITPTALFICPECGFSVCKPQQDVKELACGQPPGSQIDDIIHLSPDLQPQIRQIKSI